jgi:hypothetical protein
MGLFNSILEKLGIKKPVAPVAPAAPAAKPMTPGQSAAPHYVGDSRPDPRASVGKPAPTPSVPAPVTMPMVDVVSKLEHLAATNPQKLDWKVSIVDLLKLLDLDSSFASRKELATELGCPANLMGDSALMNTWLHKTVLQKLADNGGNIPQSLLK